MTAQRAMDMASVWPTTPRPAIDTAVSAIENYRPRSLANGSPACGNVASRAPRRDCTAKTERVSTGTQN